MGGRDGLASKDTCHDARQSEVNPCDPNGEKEEMTPECFSVTCTHTHTHMTKYKIQENK